MKTFLFLFSFFTSNVFTFSQSISARLDEAIWNLQSDEQLKHAIASIYVVNSKTGQVVYEKNSQVGLAVASAQKVITSTTALELLGTSYKYKTELGYNGVIQNETLRGSLVITGYGDPTLGSWRFTNKKENIMQLWMDQLKMIKIKKVEQIYFDGSGFEYQPLPGGWIWDDIGNYYGAGHWALNWHENQYDLILKSGEKEGDGVQIIKTEPPLQGVVLLNQLKAGKKGSGDNAYLYLAPNSVSGFVTGTIPAGENHFKIAGSFPNPVKQLEYEITSVAKANGILLSRNFIHLQGAQSNKTPAAKANTIFHTHFSPSLDSINFWFLKKSINLYGEALVKTLAFEKNGYGSLESGLTIIKNFWKDKGIETSSINLKDGSGLSPQNRVTTNALVTVMQYAKTRAWFSSFSNSLPEYNGLKMKSGTINGAKSFTGYAKSKTGDDYTFAIVVNNFNGSAAEVVKKMYRVLDVMK